MAHFGVNYQNVCLSESPTSSLGCRMPVEEILIASTAPRHWTASSLPPSPVGPRLLVQLAGSPPPWALGGHTSGAGAPDTACCVHRASVSWNKRNTVNLLGSSTCNSSKGLGWSVAEGLWQTGNEPNGQLDQKRSPRQRQRSGAGLLGQRRSPAGDDNCKMAASGDPQLPGQGGAARARSLELVGVARPGGTR